MLAVASEWSSVPEPVTGEAADSTSSDNSDRPLMSVVGWDFTEHSPAFGDSTEKYLRPTAAHFAQEPAVAAEHRRWESVPLARGRGDTICREVGSPERAI